MSGQEIKALYELEVTLVWNDPVPIKGNDYTITHLSEVNDETALIQYGEGSEAEVFLSEIVKG